MINDACSTSWPISSSTDSRWSASGPIGTAGPGSLSPRLAAISQTGYDGRNISRPAASARQRRPRRSGWPPLDPARDALWTDTDEQGSVSSGPRDQRIRRYGPVDAVVRSDMVYRFSRKQAVDDLQALIE